jgi:hypothetical protein
LIRRNHSRYLAADLLSLWYLSNKTWSPFNEFCLWCPSIPENCGKFEKWSTKTASELGSIFGIPSERVLFCTLHAALRITERLLLWLLNKSRNNNTYDDVIECIKTEAAWKSFSVQQHKNGNLKIGGWISMAKIGRLMAARNRIIDVAFGLAPESQPQKKSKQNPKTEAPPKSCQKNIVKEDLVEELSSQPSQLPQASQHVVIDIDDEISTQKIPSQLPKAGEYVVIDIDDDEAPKPSQSSAAQMNDMDMDTLDVSQLNSSEEFNRATAEQFRKLFNDWAILLCMIDYQCVTEEFVASYDKIVKNFIGDIREIFCPLKTSDDHSSFVTPYIHIICSHSVRMMSQTRGLWLFSQQGSHFLTLTITGFEHAHKVHKRIYSRHSTKGGGFHRTDPNVQILERYVVGIFFTLEDLGCPIVENDKIFEKWTISQIPNKVEAESLTTEPIFDHSPPIVAPKIPLHPNKRDYSELIQIPKSLAAIATKKRYPEFVQSSFLKQVPESIMLHLCNQKTAPRPHLPKKTKKQQLAAKQPISIDLTNSRTSSNAVSPPTPTIHLSSPIVPADAFKIDLASDPLPIEIEFLSQPLPTPNMLQVFPSTSFVLAKISTPSHFLIQTEPKPLQHEVGTYVREEGVFFGLTNSGNSCYINCVLQCLYNTTNFKNFLISGKLITYSSFFRKRSTKVATHFV